MGYDLGVSTFVACFRNSPYSAVDYLASRQRLDSLRAEKLRHLKFFTEAPLTRAPANQTLKLQKTQAKAVGFVIDEMVADTSMPPYLDRHL